MTALLLALALLTAPGTYPLAPGVTIAIKEIVEPATCWAVNYDSAQAECAEAGGMQLHRYIREHPGDWLACVVYEETEQVFALTEHDTLVLTWADGRTARSVECITAEGPAERKVQTTRTGVVCLSAKATMPTRSGGYLLMVGFVAGALPRAHGKVVFPESVERRP